MTLSPRSAVLILGATQSVGYASSVYLPATLAAPMARSVGLAPSAIFMALSAALLVQVVGGPWVGRRVDRLGGRGPLSAASLTFVAGLVGLALAQEATQLFLAWFVIGLAMAAGLYETAFAALVGWFGARARGPITGVTLIAGLASTVGWPITSWLELQLGWRGACIAWAAANLFVALPLHLSLPRRPTIAPPQPGAAVNEATGEGDFRMMAALAASFALLSGVGSAMSTALPQVLMALQAAPAAALSAASLMGPAQVVARLGELAFVRRLHPLHSGFISVTLIGGGIGLLAVAGASAGPMAVLLYGAGIGLFTIVRGTLPLTLFGVAGYGHRLAVLNIPSRLLQAGAPFLFMLGLETAPRTALAALALAALLALFVMTLLRPQARQAADT